MIRDETGAPRAEIFFYPEGKAHFYLYDDQTRLRTVVDESQVALASAEGQELILSQQSADPSALHISTSSPDGPALVLTDRLGGELFHVRRIPGSEDSLETDLAALRLFARRGRIVFDSNRQNPRSAATPPPGVP